MENRRGQAAAARRAESVFPLAPESWEAVCKALELSPQQVRIVELILRGSRDKEIANRLRLSVPTVRTHLSRIFQRVGVADRVELILRVFVTARSTGENQVAH